MAGTKRYVERGWSRINHTLADSVTNKVLHTVQERETLVRAIIDVDVESFTGQSAGSFTFFLVREPQGTAVLSPATGEDLDNSAIKELIWQKTGAFPTTGMHQKVEVDLSSMRKLDPGDEIVWRDIAANASSIGVAGTITLFFKQT